LYDPLLIATCSNVPYKIKILARKKKISVTQTRHITVRTVRTFNVTADSAGLDFALTHDDDDDGHDFDDPHNVDDSRFREGSIDWGFNRSYDNTSMVL